MNIYLVIILGIIIGEYILRLIVETLNVRCASSTLPEEFKEFYDAEKYKQAQNYLKDQMKLEFIKDTTFVLITISFILVGGFNFIDQFARGFNIGPILTGIIFAGTLVLAFQLLALPFSIYHTFVIEERYGFNRTKVKTFILDILKMWILGGIIGGIIFSGILWFFEKTGGWAWFFCWLGVTITQIFLIFLAPVLILPLFNKFVPLEEGELKDAIVNYAKSVDFKIKGIFKIDASRRSTKSNAFFTGVGKYRRIALFDTLVQRHPVEELVSILAHEIGHYKKKHFIKNIFISTVNTGMMFFILSFFINNKDLFAAFKMEHISIYASLVFFGFLYSPLTLGFSVMSNFFARKYEYEADSYAVLTYKKPDVFICALKRLTVENLSNLTPHPLKVVLDYSHPPVLARIRAIKKLSELNSSA